MTGAASLAIPRETGWVIAAAMLPFPGVDSSGEHVQDAPAERWSADLAQVAREDFTAVDLTDSWIRPGDLSPARVGELRDVLRQVGLHPEAISVIRRSVIDPESGLENLAYSHRTLEVAAQLGCSTVSVGLHRPLTSRQREALRFWTVDGPRDAQDDETWALAVARLRELGGHAADLNLLLSLEMYEDTLLGTAASSVRLVRDIGMDNVGLNPDLGNLIRLHRQIEPIEEMLELCLPHTNYWHMKNYYRIEDSTSGVIVSAPTSMELGILNYRHAVDLAISYGFNGAFCLEHYGGDGLGVMSTNRRYLEAILSSRHV
jgi:sugar phosphate isomerase/epimerase